MKVIGYRTNGDGQIGKVLLDTGGEWPYVSPLVWTSGIQSKAILDMGYEPVKEGGYTVTRYRAPDLWAKQNPDTEVPLYFQSPHFPRGEQVTITEMHGDPHLFPEPYTTGMRMERAVAWSKILKGEPFYGCIVHNGDSFVPTCAHGLKCLEKIRAATA